MVAAVARTDGCCEYFRSSAARAAVGSSGFATTAPSFSDSAARNSPSIFGTWNGPEGLSGPSSAAGPGQRNAILSPARPERHRTLDERSHHRYTCAGGRSSLRSQPGPGRLPVQIFELGASEQHL
jgi:hypothetical protein